ncbi:MAG: hypothetical protein ACJAZ3_001208 [Sphingobacteriales bacterium]|jgi:hypothetical protein
MRIVNSVVSWVMKKRIHQIELFMKYPHEVQDEWRKNLIYDARNTEWGKKYDYSSINTVKDFKNRIPIQNYESLEPYIQKLLDGEQNILWPSEIKWFAKSSGTTSNKSKFIPVSNESLEECHFKGGKDLYCLYVNNRPDANLFSGKSLVLGGSHKVNKTKDQSYYGDLSAVIIKNLPFWAEYARTPDLSIALMDNWEEKIEAMARATMDVDVTSLAGVPTWTLVLAKRVMELKGASNLKEVWPNLELYVHGAVSFNPYREQFKELIPDDDMYYLETYNASEGFFGLQDQSNSTEMLLMLDYGIYYEFIPMDEIHKDFPNSLTLTEVELNKNYAVAISTNAGLWRYMIGDTVKFTSLSPYRIQVTGRTKHFINAFGEEVIIDNAEKALSVACKKHGAIVADYTAGPIYFTDIRQEKGGHEWIIEFEKPPQNLHQFTVDLDHALCEANSDYDAKRKNDIALSLPRVHSVQKNTFYNWLKSKGKLGGQHKVPRLSNNREYLDEILEQITVK